MAKLSHMESRRMYSWWWDSHISPKNSKWLQENLTDMDLKVKSMIKLIEEDADSFARRADLYFKRRPELMKMVEEFYRAYRALAERYDHATGVIRHAHRTMSDAQLPMTFADDSPASSVSGTDPRTPEITNQIGDFMDDSDSVTRRPVERVRRGLNFDEADEKDENNKKPDQVSESEEIKSLKEAIAKLKAEKEADLVKYQQSLDKLSQLESEITKTQEDFSMLTDHANKAEKEAVVLKEALTKLETEKECKLRDYNECLLKISKMQTVASTAQEENEILNKRATTAETNAETLKCELDKLVVEKNAALDQYMQSLENISNLENKFQLAEEDAKRLKEKAEKAESEVEILKQTISKLTEEKEAAALEYQKCLETISILEQKLTCAYEEAKRLSVEIDNGVSKLKGTEEKCLLLERSNQSLHSELESLTLKMGTQTQELTEKQKELGRLWASIQEERLRFLEAETAFQTLQHLHAQTQEELRAMASELHNRAQLLNVAENQNRGLQDEVTKVKQENKHLDELNASSSLSMKDMQNEICSLKESKGKLEEEVELRLNQRNALQQEIYCLREELNDMNKKHISFLDQVHAVGLNPESFGSSVKELQDENSSLKETCKKESGEKAALLEKLVIFGQLVEKNSLLETSLSDLNAELEAVRGKIEVLEQSCQSLLKEKSTLLDEKSALITQLQESSKNLEELSENNTALVNSLSDAHLQLEALKAKSKILEDSCQLLVNEKADLISEKNGLASQLKNTQTRLDDLGKIYSELEGRCVTLEKERESSLRKIEKLQVSLEAEGQKHGSYVEASKTRLSSVEAEKRLLQEECEWRKRELDQVLDNALENEIEIFVFRITTQELKENNSALLIQNQNLMEESSSLEKKILHLEQKNLDQHVEINSLSDQYSSLRAGTRQLLKALDIVEDHACEHKTEQDEIYVNRLLNKLLNMKGSLCKAEEENLQWSVELSVLVTLIRQLSQDSKNLELEKNEIDCELKLRIEQVLVLQNEALALVEMNEELRSKLREEESNKNTFVSQIDDLNRKLMDVQGNYQVLEREKLEISEEKESLMDNCLHLEEAKNALEEENHVLCGEVFALENLSLILRSCADEKFVVLRELDFDLNKLQDMNAALMGKLGSIEGRLEESKVENLHLEEKLRKSEDELKVVTTVKDQLTNDFENGKKLLHQMSLELQEAEEKINLVETEKLELNKSVEDLRKECNEVKMVRDHQEKQILNLSTENDNLSKEKNCLIEASQKQDVELHKLQGEHTESKIREENMNFELRKRINEINVLETQAESIFGQLQYFMASHLLYEQKFHELQEACLGYVDQNEGLKKQLAVFGPEIISLKECISSLEDQTDVHIKFQNPENEELQDARVTNNPHENILNEDKKALTPNPYSELRELRVRLQAIVKAAAEVKEQMVHENIDLHAKLDASMRQLELLQCDSGHYRRNPRRTSEITEVDSALLTKDIVLDQVSDGSSYGFSKRQPTDVDSQNFDSWETSDLDGNVALSVSKSKKIVSPRAKSIIKKQKSGVSIEKELSVDKLEISKRSTESFREVNNRKVLERLDSDVQKLANLQITVQDLKKKLEVTEKGKRGKAVIECESLKGQLEEANIAIMKLFDLNGRLTKNIEDNNEETTFSDPKSSFDSGDVSARRRRVPEQARRMSEKIGRLQLEIQKIQFVLMKLDDEDERGKAKMSESKRRVLLRDYLYGGGRTGQRRKKVQFCACVQPSTVED